MADWTNFDTSPKMSEQGKFELRYGSYTSLTTIILCALSFSNTDSQFFLLLFVELPAVLDASSLIHATLNRTLKPLKPEARIRWTILW